MIGEGSPSIFLISLPSPTVKIRTDLFASADGDLRPVLLERDRDDRLVGAGISLIEFAVGRVPDADDLIGPGGGQLCAVAAQVRRPRPGPWRRTVAGAAAGSCQSLASPSEPAETSC